MTTNTIVYINNFVDKDFVVRLFSKFANKYGKLWTTRLGDNGDWASCIDDWVSELNQFTVGQATLAVNECLSLHKEFPPTQGQLIDVCLKASGVPDVSQVIRMMIDRKFDHPITKLVYEKIGSWKLSNGTEKEIHDKALSFYQQAIIDFKENPELHWKRLQDFQDMKLKELPAPDKIPTKGESAAFRECMNKCQEILKGKGIEAKTYKEFDEVAITTSNRDFYPAVYKEFCEYLLSIPETETMRLPPTYAYRRMKLISAKEQPEFLRKAGYNPNPPPKGNDPSRRQNGPSKMYKNYTGD